LKQLEQASKMGDLVAVERWLTAKPDWVNAKDDAGVSFLLNALYRRRTEVVQAYVKRRSRFDIFEASALGRTKDVESAIKRDPRAATSVSSDGFFPLGLACFYAHPETVRLLLDKGADVNQYAKTPRVQALHAAAAGWCIECVRAVLLAGADPNSAQDGGIRALHEAAANNDRAMAELLISKGADPGLKEAKGRTSAELARELGRVEMAAWLDSLSKKEQR
jgi:ankyrin repeat protein